MNNFPLPKPHYTNPNLIQIKPWTPHSALTITKTIDTEVTCYLCRGTRHIAVKLDYSLKMEVCPHCKGTGTMQNTKVKPKSELYY